MKVVEDLAKNSLSESEFPYVSKPSGGHSATSAKSSLGSVRSKQSSVGWGKRAQSQQSDALDINSIKLQVIWAAMRPPGGQGLPFLLIFHAHVSLDPISPDLQTVVCLKATVDMQGSRARPLDLLQGPGGRGNISTSCV